MANVLIYSSIIKAKIPKSWWQVASRSQKIETPENIHQVTQDMYRNAAVTHQVEHAKITVTFPFQLQVSA